MTRAPSLVERAGREVALLLSTIIIIKQSKMTMLMKPLFPKAPLVARAIPPFLPLFAYFQSFNKGIREGGVGSIQGY